jgi:hypothetical protein
MADAPAPAPPQQAPPAPAGSRAAQGYCHFHGTGSILRAPRYAQTRRGQGSAILGVATDDNRDLDLILRDRDIATLQNRLRGAVPGAIVTFQGQVHPPRFGMREAPQFQAQFFQVVANGDPRPRRSPRASTPRPDPPPSKLPEAPGS